VLVGAILAAPARAQGDKGETGFMRGDGKTDIAFSYSLDKFQRLWVGDDKVNPDTKFFRYSYNLWVSHGLSKDLDVVATADIVRADTSDSTIRDHSSVGDGTLALKWRIFEGNLAGGALSFLAVPGTKVPLAKYESDGPTALGDGQVDVRAHAVLHWQNQSGTFVAVEGGYDYRFEETPDDLIVNLSLGQSWRRFTVTPFLIYVKSMGDDDLNQVSRTSHAAESYIRYGVDLLFRLTERVSLNGGAKQTFDGENTGDSWGYWMGIVFRI
jgi:hypothetical protein